MGLVLLFPSDRDKWIKAGLEIVDGQVKRSTVVATGGGKGADWSVSSAVPPAEPAGVVRAVVEFKREEEGKGTSLLVEVGGEVVREVTWVFAAGEKGGQRDGEEDIWVGFYGARPAPAETGDFLVVVEEWALTLKDE